MNNNGDHPSDHDNAIGFNPSQIGRRVDEANDSLCARSYTNKFIAQSTYVHSSINAFIAQSTSQRLVNERVE